MVDADVDRIAAFAMRDRIRRGDDWAGGWVRTDAEQVGQMTAERAGGLLYDRLSG